MLSKRAKAYAARRDELDALDDERLIAAMAEEPTLLRRPLIVADGGYVAGFDRKALEQLTAAS